MGAGRGCAGVALGTGVWTEAGFCAEGKPLARGLGACREGRFPQGHCQVCGIPCCASACCLQCKVHSCAHRAWVRHRQIQPCGVYTDAVPEERACLFRTNSAICLEPIASHMPNLYCPVCLIWLQAHTRPSRGSCGGMLPLAASRGLTASSRMACCPAR